jgi:hypothetical protein
VRLVFVSGVELSFDDSGVTITNDGASVRLTNAQLSDIGGSIRDQP